MGIDTDINTKTYLHAEEVNTMENNNVPKIVETDAKKIIEIRSMDKTGDSKLEPQSLAQAAQVVNEQLEEGRWAYLDDTLVNEGRVTAQDLEGVGRVILSNPIIGG